MTCGNRLAFLACNLDTLQTSDRSTRRVYDDSANSTDVLLDRHGATAQALPALVPRVGELLARDGKEFAPSFSPGLACSCSRRKV